MIDQTILEACVYVTTHKKLNEGSASGKWLKLSDYIEIDEFYEACAELHDDEEDPEFMFQHYEHIPEGLISDFWISDGIFEAIEAIEDMDKDQREPFLIWCNNSHKDLAKEDIYDLISDFKIEYIGKYISKEDFARELIGERTDLTDFAREYFDYEAYAYDLFRGNYWSEGRYVFCIA